VKSVLPAKARVVECRSDGMSSECVPLSDSLQVFTMANILRRPVVVLTSDSDCGGIYLPLLWEAENCVKHPVVLAFHQGRFVPLVGSSGHSYTDKAFDCVPLVTSKFEPLRVWFLLESEEQYAHELTQRYMKLSEVNYTNVHNINMILAAQLKYESLGFDFVPVNSNAVQGERNEAVAAEATVHLNPSAPSASVLSLEKIGEENRVRGMQVHSYL
jgi:hypothetical protein